MDGAPNEYDFVERPLLDGLVSMGWEHIEVDVDVPYITDRETFLEVLLQTRLREAILRMNLDDGGDPWPQPGTFRLAPRDASLSTPT